MHFEYTHMVSTTVRQLHILGSYILKLHNVQVTMYNFFKKKESKLCIKYLTEFKFNHATLREHWEDCVILNTMCISV